MKQVYEDYFKLMYEEFPYYRRLPGYPFEARRDSEKYGSLLRNISETIAGFENRIHIKLRSDAKYFLIMNFSDMVILPFATAGRDQIIDLGSKLKDDVMLILESAIESVTNRDVREISGHDILMACGKNWGRLKTLSNDSW